VTEMDWRKASASLANSACVEVALGDPVLVRHSKDPGGPVLAFSRAEWAAFLDGVGRGEFDGAAG